MAAAGLRYECCYFGLSLSLSLKMMADEAATATNSSGHNNLCEGERLERARDGAASRFLRKSRTGNLSSWRSTTTTAMEEANIPSLSSGAIGSRFVSQDDLESAKSRREEQWKAAYARYCISTILNSHTDSLAQSWSGTPETSRRALRRPQSR